ncbi:hypothetical protein JDV02_000032 [Purpureocillium takamizusanense]|uniref:Uncharacterized protein n=1 Tax=Purpureocillium takamizusanense TaxID=2060973 RepID=A0A9Q8Q577_9HYPO|nr:uncharacterized protein JDV02_000032 [Purpureocillium takamizusanense]UNI13275.1 hypothetical protein JDV02_000032 [Purpureocillium takamizusanense]
MPSQRPYFLTSFLSAFRQQGPSLQTTQQPNKHTSQASTSGSPAASANYTTAGYSHHHHHHNHHHAHAQSASTSPPSSSSSPPPPSSSSPRTISAAAAAAAAASITPSASPTPHSNNATGRSPSAVNSIPIPNRSGARRRGSDSSSEGFRDALGADKWYIGGRTAGGEERFFKLGVVRRVRSNDGLSLDRLSL